jgi:N-acetylmuramic acid 6-phosphate etherase
VILVGTFAAKIVQVAGAQVICVRIMDWRDNELEDFSLLHTEKQNERSSEMDLLSTREILELINDEDQMVAFAVRQVLPQIETAVEWAVSTLRQGGRLVYVGAGTSGRLGVIDAAECPPTFSTPKDWVIGLIAGGEKAWTTAIEGAEDDSKAGEIDLHQIQLRRQDFVIGISASGRTPYVIGAIRYAKRLGAKTAALTANPQGAIHLFADLAVAVPVGPEVLAGSTRLKAATAHKMILNMISTATMVRLGKVYQNWMIDVNPTNQKLRERAIRMISVIAQVDRKTACHALTEARNQVKVAVIMIKKGLLYDQAKKELDAAEGNLRVVLENS